MSAPTTPPSVPARSGLIVEPNIARPDDFYEALIETHRDLPLDESHALNARLVLLLANHVGDLDVLKEALQRARDAR